MIPTERPIPPPRYLKRSPVIPFTIGGALIAVVVAISILASIAFKTHSVLGISPQQATATLGPTATPKPFDPNDGALLPDNRVIAFYGEWGAEVAGPAFELSDTMLNKLRQQGAAYAPLDTTHPIKLGIDYVADVADQCQGFPGDVCSHEMDASITQQYVDFCQKNGLVLFLDLEFGRANPRQVVADYLPYLQKYSFVHLAIDPEWYVGPYGYPGVNVGQMNSSDINWIIGQLAAIPMQYHVSRKVLLIHEFRDYVLADKQNIKTDPRVSIDLHVDSVGKFYGAIPVKQYQYDQWVRKENIQYGGFKLFYDLEAPFNSLMTPEQVMALFPQPLIVSYGN